MIVIDARLPVPPAVPIVQSPAAGATATNTGRANDDPRLMWGGRPGYAGGVGFTVIDRALIRAVTGEDVESVRADKLSAFAFQILTDRHNGRLAVGHEIDLDYLSRTSRRLSGLGENNPFSGALLRRAIQFVEARASGRVDIVL